MANGHGGKRERAGRPRKAEKYAGQIAAAEDAIAQKLPWLVAKWFELAEGVQAVRHMRNGEEVVYDKPPCFKSIKRLFEQVAGSVTQAVELTGDNGGPVEHVVVHLPHNGRDPVPDAELTDSN